MPTDSYALEYEGMPLYEDYGLWIALPAVPASLLLMAAGLLGLCAPRAEKRSQHLLRGAALLGITGTVLALISAVSTLVFAVTYANGKDEVVTYFQDGWPYNTALWPETDCYTSGFPACACLQDAVDAVGSVGDAGYLYFFAHVPVLIGAASAATVIYRASYAVQAEGDPILAITEGTQAASQI